VVLGNTAGNQFHWKSVWNSVIDDRIEAFGSEYKKKKLGIWIQTLLFFLFKPMVPNTIDGGQWIFKDKVLYEKALLVSYGIDREACSEMKEGEINPRM
jgi:dTDP-4-amino-4,6-dideoxygalactose transaminase